jgi:hypothetical protein
MIHYQLQCDKDHPFDGWFKDSASFDRQADLGQITCPLCNSVRVGRALMAPALGKARRPERDMRSTDETSAATAPAATGGSAVTLVPPSLAAAPNPEIADNLRSLLQRLRSEVEKHCDDVGQDFAEEARRIHYGERKPRGIYGETTPSEAEALADEGIEFGIMPWVRRSDS